MADTDDRLNFLESVMAAMGEQAEELQTLIYIPDRQSWEATVDEDIPVLLEWDGEPTRLVASVDLGETHEGDRPQLYEFLLSYNALWRETGGARVSVGGASALATLHFDIPESHFNVPHLLTVIVNLTDVARGLRQIVTQPLPEGVAPPDPFNAAHILG